MNLNTPMDTESKLQLLIIAHQELEKKVQELEAESINNENAKFLLNKKIQELESKITEQPKSGKLSDWLRNRGL